MKTKISLLLLVGLTWLAADYAAAATIPAGTDFVVQTDQTVRVNDARGHPVAMHLLQPVGAKGKVILPAGTKLRGKVVTSRRLASSTDRLTVDLAEVMIGDRAVPVKTTGAVSLDSFTSSRGVTVSGGAGQVSSGKTLQFRLAQPVNL
jgi:hypothetical protein